MLANVSTIARQRQKKMNVVDKRRVNNDDRGQPSFDRQTNPTPVIYMFFFFFFFLVFISSSRSPPLPVVRIFSRILRPLTRSPYSPLKADGINRHWIDKRDSLIAVGHATALGRRPSRKSRQTDVRPRHGVSVLEFHRYETQRVGETDGEREGVIIRQRKLNPTLRLSCRET